MTNNQTPDPKGRIVYVPISISENPEIEMDYIVILKSEESEYAETLSFNNGNWFRYESEGILYDIPEYPEHMSYWLKPQSLPSTQIGWVKASERLPLHMEMCFIKIEGQPYVGRYDYSRKAFMCPNLGPIGVEPKRVEWLDESPESAPDLSVSPLAKKILSKKDWVEEWAREMNKFALVEKKTIEHALAAAEVLKTMCEKTKLDGGVEAANKLIEKLQSICTAPTPPIPGNL